MAKLGIIGYMSGLTGFVLGEDVLRRIAADRGIVEDADPTLLSQQDRDLLLADILFTVLCSPSGLPSQSHQHGQFSETIGKQSVDNIPMLYAMMRRIYVRWNDDRLSLLDESGVVTWVNETE